MSSRPALAPGDMLPHVELTTVRGEPFQYARVWQHTSVAIVLLSGSGADAATVAAFQERDAECATHGGRCVLTHDAVPGLPSPGVVIADRWGEIIHVAGGLPAPQEVLDWLEHLSHRCPECEGEAR